MKKTHILWDNDGVLIDTEKYYFKATQEILLEFNAILSKELYLEFMANGKTSWHLAEEKGASKLDVDEARNRRDLLYQHYLLNENIEINGVKETLEILKQEYSMAIVTTSRPQDFNIIHKDRGLLKYMDFVLALGDYKKAKPEPDPYLAALEKFNINAENAVVIEDSSRGLKSAIAANIDCIIIENEFTKTQDFTGAKAIVKTIEEIPKNINLL